MVKDIMRDFLFLGQKAELAAKEDIAIAEDLLDMSRNDQRKTLRASSVRY